jgi:hypothetical protein
MVLIRLTSGIMKAWFAMGTKDLRLECEAGRINRVIRESGKTKAVHVVNRLW